MTKTIDYFNVLSKQLNNVFFFDYEKESIILKGAIENSIKKSEYNLSKQNDKYNEGYINPYNSCQYAMFLYYLSSFCYREYPNNDLAARVYCLNKCLNSIELFYAIELPDIFGMQHPIGAVMGRAKYSNCFYFYQNTTVGGNKGEYPKIGERVILFANATILGKSHIGDNCLISANTLVKDQDVPSNTIVFGESPNLVFKSRKEKIDQVIDQFFIM